MSALCAFYFALAHPERVARLVLVGTPPGSGMANVRYRAMPFQWPPWHPNLWRMVGWGILLARGRQPGDAQKGSPAGSVGAHAAARRPGSGGQ